METTNSYGFTLIEIIIVLSLVAVIAAFGAAMSFSSLSRTTVIQERDLFVSLLLRATRAKALANINETSHGVYIDDDCKRYIFFEGTSFTPPAAGNCDWDSRQINYTETRNDILSVNNSGGPTIIFEQLSGNVLGYGTTTISSNDSYQTVVIRPNGQIDW